MSLRDLNLVAKLENLRLEFLYWHTTDNLRLEFQYWHTTDMEQEEEEEEEEELGLEF